MLNSRGRLVSSSLCLMIRAFSDLLEMSEGVNEVEVFLWNGDSKIFQQSESCCPSKCQRKICLHLFTVYQFFTDIQYDKIIRWKVTVLLIHYLYPITIHGIFSQVHIAVHTHSYYNLRYIL